ncbi:DUF4238 domain-containing protein [Brevundimonas sp. VNH65]|uniref:DUF4238 domain-containing protein n=1 Tax=Brevundimonas sp. VNH65 TaxID=3400917 RepID=UPI003C0EABD4
MASLRKKRQHYVPQLHLRRFVGDSPRGMIWTHDMDSGVSRPSRPSETGFSSNFYSVRDQSGKWRDDIDDWLTEIEQEASAGYDHLAAGVVPQGDDKERFAAFVATLYLRSPSLIRAAAAGYGQFVQLKINTEWRTRDRFEKQLDRYDRDNRSRTENREGIWRFHSDKSRHKVEVNQSRGLSILRAAPQITRILSKREWKLVRPQSGYFISSDCPVHRFVPDDKMIWPYCDGGFANSASEITLPISPSIMLLICGIKTPEDDIWLPSQNVQILNEMRASGADRFLYSHKKSDLFVDLAKRFREAGFSFHIDGGGPYAEVVVKRRP